MSLEMVQRLTPFVKGVEVWDLGCGNEASHLEWLLRLGAKKVVAVDCASIRGYEERVQFSGVELLPRTRFAQEDLRARFQASPPGFVLISWPTAQYFPGKSASLFYLGIVPVGVVACTWGGTMCWSPGDWVRTAPLELFCEVQDLKNDLAVFGTPLTTPRSLTRVEAGGLSDDCVGGLFARRAAKELPAGSAALSLDEYQDQIKHQLQLGKETHA